MVTLSAIIMLMLWRKGETKVENETVPAQKTSRWSRWKEYARSKRMLVVAFVVLLVVVATVMFFAGGFDKLLKRSPEIEGPAKPQSKEAVAEVDAKSLAYNMSPETPAKEIADAEAKLKDRIAKAESKQIKVEYQTSLVDLYSTTEQLDKLLEATLELDKMEPTNMTAGWVGIAYERLERYSEAAKYYQIAADRSTKAENPSADVPYNRYMADKRRMEEKL